MKILGPKTKLYRHTRTGCKVVMEFIRDPESRHYNHKQEELIQKLKDEIILYKTISRGENIVDFYGLCVFEDETIIIKEYMDFSLFEFYTLVHQQISKFPEEYIGYIGIQVFNAIAYCYSKSLISLEISSSSVMLNRNGQVKICDLGEHKLLRGFKICSTIDSICYMAPENMKRVNEDESIKSYFRSLHNKEDNNMIYALGLLIIEAIYGKKPIFCQEDSSFDKDLSIQEYLPEYSNDLKEFIDLCLKRNEPCLLIDSLQASAVYKMNTTTEQMMKNFIEKMENRSKKMP